MFQALAGRHLFPCYKYPAW